MITKIIKHLRTVCFLSLFCFSGCLFAPKFVRRAPFLFGGVLNKSRLFSSRNPEFSRFFRKEAGAFDAFKYLFGIPERSFASMNLPDRINFLSGRPVLAKLDRGPKRLVASSLGTRYRGRSFWNLVGVEPGSFEYQTLARLSKFSGRDLVWNPEAKNVLKSLCSGVYGNASPFLARFRVYNHIALDKYARTQPAFRRSFPRFTILTGRSVQDLITTHPSLTNPNELVAYQSASTNDSFEGGQAILAYFLSKIFDSGIRDFTTLLSDMQQHAVQGETVASMFFLGSVYRMLLSMANTLAFGGPIQLDPDGVFYDPTTGRFQTLTIFPGGVDRSLDRVGIGFQLPGQVSFVAQDRRIADDRGGLSKNSPALAFNPWPINAGWGTSFSYCLKGMVDRRDSKRPFRAKHQDFFRRTARILDIQTLGFVQAAFINGHRTVALTGLGLGAFQNSLEWFEPALERTLQFAASKNMHVIIIVYSNDHPEKDKDCPLAKLSERVGLTVKARIPNLEIVKEDRDGSKIRIEARRGDYDKRVPDYKPKSSDQDPKTKRSAFFGGKLRTFNPFGSKNRVNPREPMMIAVP